MRMPKTMKGYISFFTDIDDHDFRFSIKGFDKLPKDLREGMQTLGTDISNSFSEVRALYEQYQKEK